MTLQEWLAVIGISAGITIITFGGSFLWGKIHFDREITEFLKDEGLSETRQLECSNYQEWVKLGRPCGNFERWMRSKGVS